LHPPFVKELPVPQESLWKYYPFIYLGYLLFGIQNVFQLLFAISDITRRWNLGVRYYPTLTSWCLILPVTFLISRFAICRSNCNTFGLYLSQHLGLLRLIDSYALETRMKEVNCFTLRGDGRLIVKWMKILC